VDTVPPPCHGREAELRGKAGNIRLDRCLALVRLRRKLIFRRLASRYNVHILLSISVRRSQKDVLGFNVICDVAKNLHSAGGQ